MNTFEKQVDKSHYSFNRYWKKGRWASLWHQIDEVLSVSPQNLLEIGVGSGVFSKLISHFGVNANTIDIDPDLQPDYIGSAVNLPFKDGAFDCVCAFQMLEHLPYEDSIIAFEEIVRVARSNIIISLPDAKIIWPFSLHIPSVGSIYFGIPKPRLGQPIHVFDGQHYWEINKKNYSLKKVLKDLSKFDIQLIKTFRVKENPYHRFFVFEKIS